MILEDVIKVNQGFLDMMISGGRILFTTDNLSVVLRSSMALQRRYSLDRMGSLRLPRGNHITVSVIQTPRVEEINILKQRL